MAKRGGKTSKGNFISEDNVQKMLDDLVRKKFDVEIDIFLKKYMNSFLRDFENQRRKELSESLVSSLFGSDSKGFSARGASERQAMSNIFSGLLKNIF